MVSGNAPNTLKAFEPDILGETHFLLFLKEIEDNLPDFEEQLSTLIAAQSDDPADKSASEFIAFITRLARNLSNDDQDGEDTKDYWHLIGQFLTSKQFSLIDPFKWTASMACFEIYQILKDKEQTVLAETFLSRVNANDLYHPPEEQISARSVRLTIQYFGLQENEGEPIPSALIALLERWERGQSRNYTALMLSLWGKNSTVARYLIEQGVDLNAISENGQWTALMFACCYDQEAVALELVKKDGNLTAQNNDGWTALMLACRYNQEAVVLELVKKDANLTAQNHHDSTALMLACRYDQEAVALELVKKDANLEAQDSEKWTALMFACRHGQEAVALELIKQDVKVSCKNKIGQTILMFAVFSSLKNVVRALLDKDVSTDDVWEYDGIECTALGLARDGEYHEIIEMLEAKGALEIPART